MADPSDEEVTIDGAAEGGEVKSKANGHDKDEVNLDDVEVIDDTPEKDKGRKPLGREVKDPTDEELSTYSAGVKQRFSELTHARHDERRARETAERERDEATRAAQALLNQNRELQQRTVQGETHLVAASKQNAEAALAAARIELKAAKEAFDPDAEMAAQEKLLEAKIQLRELERYRPRAVQAPETEVQLPAVSSPDEPVDQKTLRWQARNQWFGSEGNEDMTSFALGFHQKLVKSGVDPRSDDYFEKVDGRLREVFPDFFGAAPTGDDTRSTQRTARTSPVAPATRTVAGVTKVKLTQTQLALAKKFGLTPQQYAQEVVRLEQK
jgi:hypothetical protein